MEYNPGWQRTATSITLARVHDKAIYYECKRAMDLGITLCALVLLMPFMLLIALAIKLDSPGPVFFCQERIGAKRRRVNGHAQWDVRKFTIYKFRSMVQNADDSLHREHIKHYVQGTLAQREASAAQYKLGGDPRVTRVGKFLRKSSLDELPQLFNVIWGEMSLVGPRPVPEYEVLEYREAWHHERLATLPGMTGLWQVKGRGQLEFEDMVRLDLEYIHRQSLWLDMVILVATIPAVLTGRGAE